MKIGALFRRPYLLTFLFFALLGHLSLTEPAAGFALNDYRWTAGSTVTMHLQLVRPLVVFQDGSTSWNGSAADALNLWNAQLDTIQLVAGTPGAQAAADGVSAAFFSNTVYGSAFGSNVLAVTLYFSQTNNHVFSEADVIFNSAVQWNSYRGPLQGPTNNHVFDFHRVALHEFGHALGLSHPDENQQDVNAIMNSIIGPLDHLVDDDIAGARALYGLSITSSLNPPSVLSGNPFTYQITAANSPLSYSATGLPPGFQLNPATGLITGRYNLSGTFQVDVVAHGTFRNATGRIQIIVEPLELTSLASVDFQIGDSFSYQITTANNPTTFSATGLPAGLQLNTTTGLITGVLQVSGSFDVMMRATGANAEAAGIVLIYIAPPHINSPTQPEPTLVGDLFSYQITATNQPTGFDATGLPAWLHINHTTGLISGTATAVGTFYVTLIAHTTYGDATSVLIIAISPPQITSNPFAYGEIGQSFSYQVNATNHPTSFAATGLPAGLHINTNTGLISGIVSTPGSYPVTIVAHTGMGDATLTFHFEFFSPRITSASDVSAAIGMPFTYQITASNQPTSFASTGLPAGLHLNPAGGMISGVPELSGSYSVQISAPGAGGAAVGTVNINILPLETPTLSIAKIPLSVTGQVIADPRRRRVYAATTDGVAVVDVDSLSVIQTIPMTGISEADLSISADGNKLWVAGGYGGSTNHPFTIRSVDLNNLTPLPELATTQQPRRIREGANGRLYITSWLDAGVFQLDPVTGVATARFGPMASGTFSYCSIEASPDRKTLYVDGESSPVALERYDLSTGNSPSLKQHVEETGYSYEGRIAANPNGSGVAILTYSSAVEHPNPTLIRSATDLSAVLGNFTVPGWPSGTTFSPDGAFLFQGLINTPRIQVYKTAGYLPVRTIILPNGVQASSGSSPFAVDKDNSYLFATGVYEGGSALYVYPVIPPPKPLASPKTLINVATRLRAQTGENVLIGGFIIKGSEPKKVIVRAIGPSIPLTGDLADPTLELHTPNGTVITNDNWNEHRAEVIDSAYPPNDEHESAIVATLQPGAYTAIVRGLDNTTGVALVEVFDLSPQSNSRIANISTRGKVETGDNVMIGGFIIGGNQPTKVIVRALGPSLTARHIAGAISDTTLDLHDGHGVKFATNDDWQSDQAAEINASTVPPTDPRESAIVRTLPPGAYTAIVRGKNGTTGVALVEVYNLEPQ